MWTCSVGQHLLIEHYICCLQHWIHIQAERNVPHFLGLFFELRQLCQARHSCQRTEDPIELRVLHDGRLYKECGARGINATGQQCGGHGEDVLAQVRRIVGQCYRVHINNTDSHVIGRLLKIQPLSHCAQIVTQMQ